MKNIYDIMAKIAQWEQQYGCEFSLEQLPADELQQVLLGLHYHSEGTIYSVYRVTVTEKKYTGQGVFWRAIYPIFGDVYEKLYLEQRKSGNSLEVLDHQKSNNLFFFAVNCDELIDREQPSPDLDILLFEKELHKNKKRCENLAQELQEKQISLDNSPAVQEILQEQRNLEQKIDELEQRKISLESDIKKLEQAKQREQKEIKELEARKKRRREF